MDAQFDKEYSEAFEAEKNARKVYEQASERRSNLTKGREIVNFLSNELHSGCHKVVSSHKYRLEYTTPEVFAVAKVLATRLGYELVQQATHQYKMGLPGFVTVLPVLKVGDRIVVACDSPGFAGKLGIINDISAVNTALITVEGQEGWVEVKHLNLVPDR